MTLMEEPRWCKSLLTNTTFSLSEKDWKLKHLICGVKTCTPFERYSHVSMKKLPDPDVDPPGTEPGLVNLCKEIRSVVDQEALIIGEVFPHPGTVVQVFLQRIFLQSVLP
jgi:Exocyst complex component Sec10